MEAAETDHGPKEADREEGRRRLDSGLGEGNVATAAAAALASAATKAKVSRGEGHLPPERKKWLSFVLIAYHHTDCLSVLSASPPVISPKAHC